MGISDHEVLEAVGILIRETRHLYKRRCIVGEMTDRNQLTPIIKDVSTSQ